MPASSTKSLSISVSVAIAATVGILHYAISGVPRQFKDVYDGFGAELPWITSFLVNSPFYLWIWPTVVAGGMLLHHTGHIGRTSMVLVSTLGTLASYTILMLGLYYPIFLLGSTAAK